MPLFRPQLLKEGKKPQTEILSSKGSGGNNKDNSNEKKNTFFLLSSWCNYIFHADLLKILIGSL